MKKTALRTARLPLALSAVFFGASAAFAQEGLGDVFTTIRTDTLGPAGDIIGAISFLAGVIAAILGIWKLIQHRQNPHDPGAKPSQAIIFGIAAALLVAVPSFLGVGVTTIFGSGADTSSVEGQLRSIN